MNQRAMPSNRRRLAEALARLALQQRLEQPVAAPAENPMRAQQLASAQKTAPMQVAPVAASEAPSLAPPQAPASSEELSPSASRQSLELSPGDIKILKKVLSTEAVAGLPPEIYRQQAGGIIDTILNRRMHGKWGDSIEAVVNAPYQFSDINGPVAWRQKRRNVNDIGDDALKSGRGLLASQFVDDYLARRAAGQQSSVGGHLNYANPHYSDASNLAWIRKLDGPRYGQGDAVHWHGTAQGLTPVDPNYAIRIAGQQRLPSSSGITPTFRAGEAAQSDAPPHQPPLLPQQLGQMPDAASVPLRRNNIHPAILEALMKRDAAPPAGIAPELWKHMSDEERVRSQLTLSEDQLRKPF